MEEIVRNLRSVAEQYKNAFTSTGSVRIADMATDCANHIEKLETDLDRYRIAEQEGRLVELPCKVGEYWARDGKRYIVAEITMTNAWGVMVRHYEEGDGKMLSCNPQYFAKHYTRAEADAASKEAADEHRKTEI